MAITLRSIVTASFGRYNKKKIVNNKEVRDINVIGCHSYLNFSYSQVQAQKAESIEKPNLPILIYQIFKTLEGHDGVKDG